MGVGDTQHAAAPVCLREALIAHAGAGLRNMESMLQNTRGSVAPTMSVQELEASMFLLKFIEALRLGGVDPAVDRLPEMICAANTSRSQQTPETLRPWLINESALHRLRMICSSVERFPCQRIPP